MSSMITLASYTRVLRRSEINPHGLVQTDEGMARYTPVQVGERIEMTYDHRMHWALPIIGMDDKFFLELEAQPVQTIVEG